MTFAENQTVFGLFTATGAPMNIELGFMPSFFQMWNWTQYGLAANPATVKEALYHSSMVSGEALYIVNTVATRAAEQWATVTGGFIPYSGIEEVLSGPQATAGAITQAANAQVTLNGHGFNTGDIVRLYGTTGMLQYAGLDFLITRTGANTFTLDGGNTAAFAAPATACIGRQVIQGRAYQPGRRVITLVTAASPGVVTTSTAHGFVTGQKVRLHVSAPFGMVELNDQLVTVTSLTATTFSIGIDTSTFTPFACPTSAVAATGVTHPEAVPVGEVSTILTGAQNNTSYQGIRIGATILTAAGAGDIWKYRAERSAIQ